MAPPPNTPATPAATTARHTLLATYSSPDPTKSHSFEIPLLSSATLSSTVAKAAYLSGLRTAVTGLQTEINTLLTQRMEEDREADAGVEGGAKRKRDVELDVKEEENYGEELVEDEQA